MPFKIKIVLGSEQNPSKVKFIPRIIPSKWKLRLKVEIWNEVNLVYQVSSNEKWLVIKRLENIPWNTYLSIVSSPLCFVSPVSGFCLTSRLTIKIVSLCQAGMWKDVSLAEGVDSCLRPKPGWRHRPKHNPWPGNCQNPGRQDELRNQVDK